MASDTTPKIRYNGVSGLSNHSLNRLEVLLEDKVGPLEPGSEWSIYSAIARKKTVINTILETLYMISDDSLLEYMVDGITLEHIFQIKELRFDSANAILRGLIGPKFDSFVQNLIRSLGYGYFLSAYDGQEITINSVWGAFYAYRDH